MKTSSNIKTTFRRRLLAAILLPALSSGVLGQETSLSDSIENFTKRGAWEIVSGSSGQVKTHRRTLYLAPKLETKPALSVRFFPNAFHSKPGNAAIYYLKAGGFFEQTKAFSEKRRFEEEGRKLSSGGDAVPYVWLETDLNDIPLDQLREYLSYTQFQIPMLKEATMRRLCDFDRQIRTVDDPVAYLLPEIQAIRDTARMQGMRFLLAMGEDRPADAIETLGQMLAMGPHLAQDPFLVSNLVGLACVGVGLSQAHYLSEHTAAPNLYWALATLPRPFVDLNPSLEFEFEFLFEQVKRLREVDEEPKPDEYWKGFIGDFMTATQGIDPALWGTSSGGEADFVFAIATNVPNARAYLKEIEEMSEEQLETLPNTQIFFLAVRRFHERYRDEEFKFFYLPEHARTRANPQESGLREMSAKYGLFTEPANAFIPAVRAAWASTQRVQQQLNAWQTIESIRHHLASHDNQLPESLADLELPAPYDPLTNQPFEYTLHDSGATLKTHPVPGLRYQFELRVQSPSQQP